MYEFNIRAVAKDPTGYYQPRWDTAQRITVKAETRGDALSKAKAVLGECDTRIGWSWKMIVDDIQEV